MKEVIGSEYVRSGENLEWPTVSGGLTLQCAILYRDMPTKGLRTYPNKKSRLNKKEIKKRMESLIAIVNFE